jgi:cation diffusion facilitator CzcD-associated flavoprotein CzcO
MFVTGPPSDHYDEATGSRANSISKNADPGCAVDIPAMLYSLSFAPNPNFLTLFPGQEEILDYIQNVAKKFDVTRHVCFSTSWEGATWNDKEKRWNVTMKDVTTGRVFEREYSLCCGRFW